MIHPCRLSAKVAGHSLSQSAGLVFGLVFRWFFMAWSIRPAFAFPRGSKPRYFRQKLSQFSIQRSWIVATHWYHSVFHQQLPPAKTSCLLRYLPSSTFIIALHFKLKEKSASFNFQANTSWLIWGEEDFVASSNHSASSQRSGLNIMIPDKIFLGVVLLRFLRPYACPSPWRVSSVRCGLLPLIFQLTEISYLYSFSGVHVSYFEIEF